MSVQTVQLCNLADMTQPTLSVGAWSPWTSPDMSGHTNPISKVLLDGLYDQECALSRLRGCQHIMRTIWDNITVYWKELVELPVDPQLDDEQRRYGDVDVEELLPSCLYLTPISSNDPGDHEEAEYYFPPPSDININMMPFIVGETFESSKLPEFVRPYWPMIKACLDPEMSRAWHHMWPKDLIPSEVGKVNYLTIQESWVEPGTSQRRPGLHVDRPGEVKIKQDNSQTCIEGEGSSQPYRFHRWGAGCAHYIPSQDMEDDRFVLRGGIYLASSLPSSSRAWNCSVEPAAVGR